VRQLDLLPICIPTPLGLPYPKYQREKHSPGRVQKGASRCTLLTLAKPTRPVARACLFSSTYHMDAQKTVAPPPEIAS
jgi:hypothetical protein